jgi:ribosomal protein S18 acetylase RimI-like enzyme
MSARERKVFDIDIQDLRAPYVDECARLHMLCFPQKIETLLGHECITDCLRRRYINPPGDCYCRIAIDKASGRMAGYLYAETMLPGNPLSNAFLSPAIAREHLRRRAWLSPRIWMWLAKRVWRKVFWRDWNEGATQDIQTGWEVAKMLAIHPDFRGGNVGVDLMLDHEKESIRRGGTRVCGLVERDNIKAEKLYKSVGWARTSPATDEYYVFAMHKDVNQPTQE